MAAVLSTVALLASSAIASPLEPRTIPLIGLIPSSQWTSLNSSVNGRLNAGIPFARPCFSSATTGTNGVTDAAQCQNVQQFWSDSGTLSNTFGAWKNPFWGGACQANGKSCSINTTDPANDPSAFAPPKQCDQGSVPDYYVDARTDADVQAVFKWLTKQLVRIPLVIKNTGHDYLGRSSAPDSLAIWTHNLNTGIAFNEAFVANECAASDTYPAFTYGAGTNLSDLYAAANARNYHFVGGSSGGVGAAGGFMAGGGHSSLAPVLGLAVDQVLQIKVVTPDGVVRTVSKCSTSQDSKDLFFALRGGGGSTYGVVTEVTSKLSPAQQMNTIYAIFNNPTKAQQQRLIEITANNTIQWSEAGCGGYIIPGAFFLMYTANSTVNMTDLFKDAIGLFTEINAIQAVVPFPSFYYVWSTFLTGNTGLGWNVVPNSYMVSKAAFSTPAKRLAVANATGEGLKVMEPYYNAAGLTILFTTPAQYKGPSTGHSSNPNWYNAYWHIMFNAAVPYDASPDTIATYHKASFNSLAAIRKLSPNSGAYFNEAAMFETNPTANFWGQSNYIRLVGIKAKFDPTSLLNCYRCVAPTTAQYKLWLTAPTLALDGARFACYPPRPSGI